MSRKLEFSGYAYLTVRRTGSKSFFTAATKHSLQCLSRLNKFVNESIYKIFVYFNSMLIWSSLYFALHCTAACLMISVIEALSCTCSWSVTILHWSFYLSCIEAVLKVMQTMSTASMQLITSPLHLSDDYRSMERLRLCNSLRTDVTVRLADHELESRNAALAAEETGRQSADRISRTATVCTIRDCTWQIFLWPNWTTLTVGTLSMVLGIWDYHPPFDLHFKPSESIATCLSVTQTFLLFARLEIYQDPPDEFDLRTNSRTR